MWALLQDICPPHRPDLKPYVERFIRAQKEECIYPHRPATVVNTRKLLGEHRVFYNSERPNQTLTCNNQPSADVQRLATLATLTRQGGPRCLVNAL